MAEANRVYINFKYDKEVRKRIYKEQQFGEIRQGLLLELFPNLNGVPFEVTYMDNEKTVIRVTDQEDWTTALESSGNNCLFFINEENDSSSSTSSSSPKDSFVSNEMVESLNRTSQSNYFLFIISCLTFGNF
jgi:hypothetical protein